MPTTRQFRAGLRALHDRVRRGDQHAGYLLLIEAGRQLAPSFLLPEDSRAWMHDESYLADYRALTGGGLLEMADKKLLLRSLARWTRPVPGSIAECGAYRGVSAWFMADATDGTGKVLHLFDSFEGLSDPTAADGVHWQPGDLAAGEAECRRSLGRYLDRAVLHKGWIPERFPDVAEESFSLVHIDVDLYQPHVDAIEFFWPRLAPGGVLLFDDYGSTSCPGARQAVDEAFPVDEIVESPSGQAFVVKRA